jgi:hypothetical protein
VTAYATAASLELYLQRQLSGEEGDAAALAVAAASDYIDRYVGKSWQGTTISGEVQTVPKDGIVRLDRRPVASVTTVLSRPLLVGVAPLTLVAGTDYELLDPLNGIVLVHGYGYVDAVISTLGHFDTALIVTYVVGSPAPAAIQQAANIIAAQYLTSAVAYFAQSRGIQKLKAGSAEITYDPIDAAATLPPAAQAILDAYRPAMAFA